MSLKVWYDRKRDCYSTNAAMIYAKQEGIPTRVAAAILLERVGDKLALFCESIEYEEPGGVVWKVKL